MADVELTDSVDNSWPFYGHDWAVQLLQNAIDAPGSLADNELSGPNHAYLFTGPRHIGKTTLARIFAQALLCERRGNDSSGSVPCNRCRACRLMSHGVHPDFRLVQPVDKAGEVDRIDGLLRVEQATDLVHEVATRPLEGRYKLFLIQDIHRANDSFANKMLKTLEEPPPHVILCLTAEDDSLLLPTIISRCQVLALRPLERETVRQALQERWQLPTPQAELLARLANGRLGWAVGALDDDHFLDSRQEGLETLWRLAAADRVDRLAYAAKLATDRNSGQIFGLLALWTGWWRDVMLTQSGCGDACSNIDHAAQLARQAESVPMASVRRYLQTLQRLEGYLHHTVNVRLALDVLVLKLPKIT